MKKFLIIWLTLIVNFSAKAENADTISLSFHWTGVYNYSINKTESFNTIGLQNAVYLPDFNYLPGFEIQNLTGKVENLQVVHWTGDTLSTGEKRIFDHLFKDDIKPFHRKNKKLEGNTFTDVLIFPFIFDSLQSRFYKVSTIKIKYDTSPAISNSVGNHQRTSGTGSSVLASGDWYKIAVTENGIYKIDRTFLARMGIDVNNVNPKKIKIYGNGGGLLPQKTDTPRPTDLFENAIYIAGEADGTFGSDDYILFYGQGPHKINLDKNGEVFYSHNFYSDTTYYFLTTEGTDGKRITTHESMGTDYSAVKSYNDVWFHEVDDVNIIRSGREWFGEKFDATLSRTFDVELEGAVPNSTFQLTVAALGQTYTSTSMDVSVNSQKIGEIVFPSIPEGAYFTKGIEKIETVYYTVKSNEDTGFKIELKFNKVSGVRSSAYLNYFTGSCERSLKANGQLSFRSLKSLENALSTFHVAGATSQIRIWDISSPLEPIEQKFGLEGTVAKFGVETTGLKEFILFTPQSNPGPVFVKKIDNRDIRSESTPDLIIVVHPDFLNEAERLANYRRSNNDLEVLVVTPEMVYNEFSSGSQDVTAIRDMVKHFYDKGGQTKLKNLLLFGKSSFDYKNRESNNTNFVPIYSSRNSTHPVSSYSSDDYYAILENGEGEWEENYSGDHTLDIGIGRLPVTTSEEAKIVVDKLIYYDSGPAIFGEWRNQITLVADDGDGNIHQEDAEELAQYLDTAYARFNTNKIYVDAYPQIKSASGEAAPEVNKAINNAISKGSLLINYTGHGSETRWCSETVLDINMIKKWTNLDKLPLFITATCEFGKHDDPAITSGAEYLLLNSTGGAIGLVTTSRPVYSNTNFDINYAFYKNVFKKSGNAYSDLGEIFKNTKNGSLRGSNNRNFSLLGDPSMKLALAENDIKILAEKENVKSPGDTLKALELVRLQGKVVGFKGEDLPEFNGKITATVYDKSQRVQTLGNEGVPFSYSQRNSIIFKGDASVKNGEFSLEFVIPKAISYSLDKGKINFYAHSENLPSDAAGSDLTFTIGGSGNFAANNEPPLLTLFINDTTFKEKGVAGENVVTLAKIEDENGINILNGEINRGIIISLDGEEFKYAGDFFKNDLDDYKMGWLKYPFFDLEEGHHKVLVGAYDTHNNYSEKEIEFYVSNSEKFVVNDLFNYPNPFSEKTTFTFEHNRAGDDLEFFLDIFSMDGKKIYTSKYVTFDSSGRIDDVRWDGRNSDGKKIEPGIYVYVIRIRSLKDSSNIKIVNKLLFIN